MIIDTHNTYGNHNAFLAAAAKFFKEDAPTYVLPLEAYKIFIDEKNAISNPPF